MSNRDNKYKNYDDISIDEPVTKIITGFIIILVVSIIVYFICVSFKPKGQFSYYYSSYPTNNEGFIHSRLISGINSENTRPNEATRIDYKAINDSLVDVSKRSNGELFEEYNDKDMKNASNDKNYYMDKINGTRWKRGLYRQQQNKQNSYQNQTSIDGASTANNRVNYTGLSALGTVKGNVEDSAQHVNNMKVSNKGTKMFKHLNNATIDDRGYAKPESFAPTNNGNGLLTNARLAGGAMNLNALNGTMWKKYKPINPTSPYPAEMNIMEGKPTPLTYESNTDW